MQAASRRFLSLLVAALVALQLPIVAAQGSDQAVPAAQLPSIGRAALATVGPTATLTLTPTATGTSTATAILTPTASATLTPTPMAPVTPTATFTPTGTPTATPRPTATRTATPRPTPTPRRTATPRPTPTATPRARISVAPTAISPGGVLVVDGTGFARLEVVDVGLDKTPYASSRATDAEQLPSTGFAVPLTAAPGRHTVFARGLSSHRRAYLTVRVRRLQPRLQLDRTTANVGTRLCATGTTFLPGESVTLAVNAVANAAATASPGGSFSVCFATPANIVGGSNNVTAVGASSRATALARFRGVLALASTFYFVGASTAAGDDTALTLLNPQSLPSRVTLTFYRPAAAPFTRALTVAAYTRSTTVLRVYVSGVRGFGLRVQADRVVAAHLVVRRGAKDPYSTPGSSLLEKRWYLAEGYTGLTFHETIYVLNTKSVDATVQVHLLPFNGGPARIATYIVPAQRTYRIDVNRLFPHASLAAIVTSDRPVAVERVMTFGAEGYGATGNTGSARAATSWLFAEGSTANGFQTFLTILNPSARPATVTALFFDTRGHVLGGHSIVVDPRHRGNVLINATVHTSSVATSVTSNQPIVVERPIYFGSPNGGRTGGSIDFGRNGTSLSWLFPDGDTTLGAHEYLLALNPTPRALQLHATFYLTNGRVVAQDFAVPGSARLTINVNTAVPGVAGTLHGAQLSSTNNMGFIAEQSIYNGSFTAGYSTAGLAQ